MKAKRVSAIVDDEMTSYSQRIMRFLSLQSVYNLFAPTCVLSCFHALYFKTSQVWLTKGKQKAAFYEMFV